MQRRSAFLASSTTLALFALSCSEKTPIVVEDAGTIGGCELAYLGQSEAPIQIVPVALEVDGVSREVKHGSVLPLIFPPQGGRVIFAAVRATNLDPCGVKLSGTLRDTNNGQVRIDVRTVNLVPSGNGWGGPDDLLISDFSNVPICPNQWSTVDAFGNPYELIVDVKDRGGKTATATVRVSLACAEPQNEVECRCLCKKGYILGEACGPGNPPDGGAMDAANDVEDANEHADP